MGEECEDAAEEGKGKEQNKEPEEGKGKEPGGDEEKQENKEPEQGKESTHAVQPGIFTHRLQHSRQYWVINWKKGTWQKTTYKPNDIRLFWPDAHTVVVDFSELGL